MQEGVKKVKPTDIDMGKIGSREKARLLDSFRKVVCEISLVGIFFNFTFRRRLVQLTDRQLLWFIYIHTLSLAVSYGPQPCINDPSMENVPLVPNRTEDERHLHVEQQNNLTWHMTHDRHFGRISLRSFEELHRMRQNRKKENNFHCSQWLPFSHKLFENISHAPQKKPISSRPKLPSHWVYWQEFLFVRNFPWPRKAA